MYIFSDADFMKEAANSLLKVLEEPPEFATIFLLTDNPSALLPTIRSRCMHLRLAPRPGGGGRAVSGKECVRSGSPASARWWRASAAEAWAAPAASISLPYLAARQDALTLLGPALGEKDHSALFRVTDTYRSGAEGKAKTEQTDPHPVFAAGGPAVPEVGHAGVGAQQRHPAATARMADAGGFCVDRAAANRLGEVESGMRRNLLRSLALDSFATSLER